MKDLSTVIKDTLRIDRCPPHHLSYRLDKQLEIYCNRCDLSMIITPDIKEYIDVLYKAHRTKILAP